MSNVSTPSEGEDLRAALERELNRRRGRAPEPGEIFVLSETAELPVEWVLLEARPKAFLAIPADSQPLAGSRDFALGANVLSGPLVLRCGHAVEIAASRIRPELRTGLLDPHSLAAARSLQAALAAGTAAEDPLGEEVDRDPEYRDWVEEVLDPARAVLVGLSEMNAPTPSRSADVIPFEDRRSQRTAPSRRGQGSTFLRVLPWLAAAGLAVAFGWERWQMREVLTAASAARFDEPGLALPSGTVRGETEWKLPPATGIPGERVRFLGYVPSDLPEAMPMALILLDHRDQELARSAVKTRNLSDEWSISLLRSKIPPGSYRIKLQSAGGKDLAFWDVRVVESPPTP
jgi:hypothetical protein